MNFWLALVVCASLILMLSVTTPTASAAPGDPPASDVSWPQPTPTQKPRTRWWWLGSAVDKENLTREMEAIAKAGLGGVEITPIYGAAGYEDRYIDFLSPKFMEMLRHVGTEGKRLGIAVDMATGTGWPFGGPWIAPEDADASLSRDGDKLGSKPTRMKVKRAAPGDEGWVANPYSTRAIEIYLVPFTKAFASFPRELIGSQFHDSFEYSGNWTDTLPAKFKQMHGYELSAHVGELFGQGEVDTMARVKSDYRQTLAELHMEYGEGWIKWSREHGFLTREQAHGAPANLLDLYGASDIPETETFGFSDFPIPGFRADSKGGAHPQPQPMISRFASSAGHVAGRSLISSETFTWLREHFNVALSQCKPVADQIFLAGINHLYYHGTCYSPADAPWPGWLFYASTEFHPNNTLWRDSPALNGYLQRCQSILQNGSPDNDVLVYWPIYDLWSNPQGLEKRFAMGGAGWAHDSAAGKLAKELVDQGHGFDYISDAQLLTTKAADGQLQTPGSRYRVLLVPATERMPLETLRQIMALADGGATVIFAGHLPTDVPGLSNLDARRADFAKELARVSFAGDGTGQSTALGRGRVFLSTGAISEALLSAGARREAIADTGVGCIRRRTSDGHDYFFANLTGKPMDSWVTLGSPCASAVILDPLTGNGGVAATRKSEQDQKATQVYLQLLPGESLVLRCLDARPAGGAAWAYNKPAENSPITVTGNWQIDFIEGGPTMPAAIKTDKLASWTALGDDEARRFAGTARYRIEFDLPQQQADDWQLHLGDVRESARVRVNGQDAGTIWSLPYAMNVGPLLKPGSGNVLELEITNLAANRIRDMDKTGAKWKVFHEINYVDIRYKKFDASTWDLVDSGLLGPVTLTPMKRKTPQ